MNKIALTVIIIAGVVVGVPLTMARVFENMLYKRYPELDRKAVREAYAQFMTNCANGDYGDSNLVTLEMMYPLLDEIVRKQTSSN